ncbi:hypothetical protein [Amycolatopsis sp. H20-H5]|uniref:hypothetical protein n=1 Tax=Amycolatopsis sp. H20-H5 TaxID=3046309 RepID=UPI002DB5F3C8|nr:hypothetical protein [Amycolatopsis sp. H20-H5]MEC3978043.1 hypothetical protein [Amycolatopsis sp. H20-H5]
MSAPPYVRALEAAKFIMGPPSIKGIPLWRGAGLRAVQLLIEGFLALVARREEAAFAEHGFLSSAEANKEVFGSYANVYELLDVPGHPGTQFRSDNIVTSIARLQREDSAAPVVAVGSILRDAAGKTPPLFRDRNIWPVVELNQLADSDKALELLGFYATVIEDLLWSIGVPSVTVETPALASYGKTTYLTVAVLPNKRPTVLATLYILADELRVALGEQHDVIDVGFTGKLLATAAMVHVDARGLALPSTIAPVQVGVTLSAGNDQAQSAQWLEELRAGGLRCETTLAGSQGARARAEQAWHRRSVPLVIGLDRTPGAVTTCTRLPIKRTELPELPSPQAVHDLLAAGDARLAKTARRLFDSAMDEGGHLRSRCDSCAEDAGLAVFGVVVPRTPVRCERCGTTGQRLFISDEGRFY